MLISEISRKLKIPRYYIDYWKNTGLLDQTRDHSYTDLLTIKFIHHCRSRGASLQSIRSYISNVPRDKKEWYQNLQINETGTMLIKTREDPYPVDPFSGQFYLAYHSQNDSGPKSGEQAIAIDFENRHTEQDIYNMPGYIDALNDNNVDKCIRLLNDHIKQFPGDYEAWLELGNHHFEKKEYRESKKKYYMVLDLQPDCVQAIYNLANLYLKEKKHAAAIRYYRKCIQIDPDFPETWYNLGLLLLSLNYLAQAIECMEEYCRLDRDSHWGQQAADLLEELNQRDVKDLKKYKKNELLPFPTKK